MSLGVTGTAQREDNEYAKAMALVTTPEEPMISIFTIDNPESADFQRIIHDVVQRDALTLENAVGVFKRLTERFVNEKNKEAADKAALMVEIAQDYCDSSRSIEKATVSTETAETMQQKLNANQAAVEDIIGGLYTKSKDEVTMAVAKFRDTALHFDDDSKERYPILIEAEEKFNYTLQKVLQAHRLITSVAEAGMLDDIMCITLVSDEWISMRETKQNHYDPFFTGVKLTLEMITGQTTT